jgi:signal transduction histidine kinase
LGVPVAGAQLAQHSSDLHELIIAAVIALAVMAGVSLALGWLVASHFLVPLRAITSTTRDISATNLHERLNIAGPDDEIKELADTFDDLLEPLERAFDFERQFVANASHELRTPLATMRASLDVAMAKGGPVPAPMAVLDERLRRELDHVDRLLDSFLSLARAQRGVAGEEATVSLDEAVAAAIGNRSGAIWNMGLSVDQRLCRKAWAWGSPTLLARMVDNIVDNAVNHNQHGGWLQAQTSSDGAFVRLTVENGGAVIEEGKVNELARPFRRLGAERTGSERGSGLGLSIARSIAEAHGGALQLQPRDGGGLKVVITLPLAKASTVGTSA